jgi:iron(III) transport system substrate-binding protein
MRFNARSIALAAFVAVSAATAASAQEVNLYTTREPGLIQPMLDAFTKATNIKVNAIFIKDGLAQRVKTEGANSPADMLMTVDLGVLVDAVDQGITQPVTSEALASAVPAHLRDKEGNWYALSQRARLIYASKNVKETAITYEELADPKWKGKICIRSGQHPYNTALVAAFLVRNGEAKTEAWLNGIKANLARKPAGGDREVARDILGGVCEIGIANSYYVGLMRSPKASDDHKKWGDAIKIIFPTFQGGGTHVNISGAAVAKNSPNKANATKLMEYLVSNDAQSMYATVNYEFPVRSGAKNDPIIEALGSFKSDTTDLAAIAKARKQASALIDKVGFDQ